MTENEVRELEQIIDEQQERIEALEEALCDLVSYAENARMLQYTDQQGLISNVGRAKQLLDRQQAGGNDA